LLLRISATFHWPRRRRWETLIAAVHLVVAQLDYLTPAIEAIEEGI
jgi:hypothetical protein